MKMIDRIWYAAEKWRQNEGNHLTGDLVLQTISLWILVPIVGPLTYRLHWLLALLLMVVIGVSPLIFCHARYTSERRDQLDKKVCSNESAWNDDIKGLLGGSSSQHI